MSKGAAQSARDAGETKALRQDRFPKARLSYLVKEFCGIHDPSDPYVYVSDGGHWENTGLVELLRTQRSGDRMPREVIAIDADPGNPGPCTSSRAPSTWPVSSAACTSTSTSTRCVPSPPNPVARRTRGGLWLSG